MENQGEGEVGLTQQSSLLSFWQTECSCHSLSNEKQSRAVFLPSKCYEGLLPSFPILHSFQNLIMIAGGEGCLLVLKHLLEEPVNLSNILRMPGEVFLTILEPASVNTLCSMLSIVACFSPGHFSRHTQEISSPTGPPQNAKMEITHQIFLCLLWGSCHVLRELQILRR